MQEKIIVKPKLPVNYRVATLHNRTPASIKQLLTNRKLRHEKQ